MKQQIFKNAKIWFALVCLAVLAAISQTTDAASSPARNMFMRSRLKQQAAYRDLRGGPVSSAQFLKAYAHAQNMPLATSLPAIAQPAVQVNTKAALLPGGRW